MERMKRALTCVALIGSALAACASPQQPASPEPPETAPQAATTSQADTGTAEPATPAPPPADPATTQPETPFRLAYAYDAMLDNPAAQFPEPRPGHDGSYAYAFADIDGDTLPEMLLRENGSGERPVAVLYFNGERIVAAENTLADASGYAGEGETLLFTSGSYPGLEEYRFGETTLTVTTYELRSGRLEQVGGPQETIVGNPLRDVNTVRWRDIEDAGLITALDKAERVDPFAQPLSGTFRQYSPQSAWRGDDFAAVITFPHITYPDLGCVGTLEPTPPNYPGQAGFIEHITQGSCDNGGTWHFVWNANTLADPGAPAISGVRYLAPDAAYVADGNLQ